jgi:DUF971 family protein
MSFWDHIKPSKAPPRASAVDLSPDRRTVTLTWEDGKVTRVTAQTMRQACPCAECVEEFSGRRVLDVSKVPESLTIVELAQVGNYALTFTFGDAHRIGIFNWGFLRELSEKNPAA